MTHGSNDCMGEWHREMEAPGVPWDPAMAAGVLEVPGDPAMAAGAIEVTDSPIMVLDPSDGES